MAFQTPVTIIGGSSGGSQFSHYGGTNGKVMEKIGVWAATSRIKAIKVWLTDEEPRMFGKSNDPAGESPLKYKEFTFQPAELITRMSLWGNGAGTRAGWIYFQTNGGRVFDFGMYDWGKQKEYPIDVASGICAGVMGRAGDDLDSIGFVFMKPIRSSKLVNVQYPTLSFETAGISPQTLKEFNHVNNTTSPTNWEFAGSNEVTVSSSWSVSTGLAVHATVTVQAGIPLVAEVSSEFGWEVSATTTSETSKTETDTLSWGVSGTLQPGESVSLKAITRKGMISIPYTGSIEVTLVSGHVFQYPLNGQYAGVSYSGVTVT